MRVIRSKHDIPTQLSGLKLSLGAFVDHSQGMSNWQTSRFLKFLMKGVE
jgi:hypothetical protein